MCTYLLIYLFKIFRGVSRASVLVDDFISFLNSKFYADEKTKIFSKMSSTGRTVVDQISYHCHCVPSNTLTGLARNKYYY